MSDPTPKSARRRLARLTAGAAALLCTLAVPAAAEAKWQIPVRGWGHGIGMSQWGAFGHATNGIGYHAILGNYYTGTTVDPVPSETVRVLFRTGGSSYTFKHAIEACGRSLNKKSTYRAVRSGSSVLLRNSAGSTLKNCGGKLTAIGADSPTAGGRTIRFVTEDDTYRGNMEFGVRSAGGLRAVNAVGLDSYVKGVVPKEVPSSWPAAALKAQAVAARSYGIATTKGGNGWDHYRDTRSQVYGGYEAETAATNSAVAGTALRTVKHNGSVATTFFFSTSGGKTEDIDCAWNTSPQPYLKGYKDKQYDQHSPVHKTTVTYTGAQMRSRLSGLFSGSFLGIDQIKRCVDNGGFSGRIMTARVRGSSGSTTVSGDTLRNRLGLRSTWASFNKI